MGVLKRFLNNQDVQVVSVCDVNRGSHGYKNEKHFYGRKPALNLANEYYASRNGGGTYKGCEATADFRQLIDRPDVDAVAVVTPDHWHSIMTIRAAAAGKDVYCEKPLALTIGQGREIVEAVRKHNRVMQTGSMERSSPINKHLCQLVREGRIGKVRRVITKVGPNNKTGPGPGWEPMPVPDELDYDMWLGPAPQAPYHKDRCLYRFRFNFDYAGGQNTNLGAHSNDLAQWGLGMDTSGPIRVECVSAEWPAEGSLYNTSLHSEYRCYYANGVELICRTTPDHNVGVRFEGDEGWLESSAYPWIAQSEPASLITDKFPEGSIRFDSTAAHIRNFLDCVKSREEPAASAEVGHRSATICHLGNIALRLNANLDWDPESETFSGPDADRANKMLHREQRTDWMS